MQSDSFNFYLFYHFTSQSIIEKRKAWVTKTLVRRGMASIQLNNMKAAVEDYREACQINPNDTVLKNDLKKLEESCGGL